MINGHLQAATEQQLDWTEYLRGGATEIHEALGTPASPTIIRGIPESMTESEVVDQIKTLTGEYANALLAWPEIREASREISARMLDDGDLIP